jgi:hypothetical protein
MRLFGTINESIGREDRAEWMTPPFDGPFASSLAVGGPYAAAARGAFVPGGRGSAFVPRAGAATAHLAGADRARVAAS